MCSREGVDPDQAGAVHSGRARLTWGAVDTGKYPVLSAALLRVGAETSRGWHLRDTLNTSQSEGDELGLLCLVTNHDTPDFDFWLFQLREYFVDSSVIFTGYLELCCQAQCDKLSKMTKPLYSGLV